MITYTKLRDDNSWGLRSPTPLKSGDSVEVSLRNGGTKTAIVGDFRETVNDRYGEGHLYTQGVPVQPEREKVDIGNLSGITALFDKARRHLKRPAIVLLVGFDDEQQPCMVRISVAGENARVPGSLNVTEYEGEGTWFGRVLSDGKLEVSPRLKADDPDNLRVVTDKLREFADDPVRVATEHGRLTGKCCFCNIRLKDERSTAVGYGPVCAEHYELPWGVRPAAFAEAV